MHTKPLSGRSASSTIHWFYIRQQRLPSCHIIYYYLPIDGQVDWVTIYAYMVWSPSSIGSAKSMTSLENYPRLTIRISKLPVVRRSNENTHGYCYLVRADELPGCCAHGSSITDALQNFQKTAELWLSWFGNHPPQVRIA